MLQRITLTALALGVSSVVSAQVIQAPPRQRQLPPPPVTHDLTLNMNALGGYDRAPGPLALAGLPPVGALAQPTPSGAFGSFDSALTYVRSSTKRSFNASTRGYVNRYQNSGTGAFFGGDAAVGVGFNGRRNSLNLDASYTDSPYYHLGVLGTPGGVAGNPTLGYTTGRTWTANTGASWNHEFSRTTEMTARYSFGRYGYNTATTPALVGQYFNESHNGSLDLNRSIGRNWDLQGGLRRSVVRNHQGFGYRPTIDDSVDGGVSYSRVLSATKGFNFSVKSGASRVQSNAYTNQAAYEFWTPIFSTSVGVDVGRSWSINADYRRNVTVPYALNTTQSPYVTHNVGGGVGGQITDRIKLIGNTALTNGKTNAPSVVGGQATYRGYTVTGQMDFLLSDSLTAMFNVSHVQTRMNILASQAFGVVPNLKRTQARVGLSWTLPLIGRGRGRTGN